MEFMKSAMISVGLYQSLQMLLEKMASFKMINDSYKTSAYT